MTEQSADETFMRVLSRIPAAWTCCKCGRTGENAPGSESPVGVQHRWNPEKRHNEIVGDICKDCMGK